jgi:hypothetical protein
MTFPPKKGSEPALSVAGASFSELDFLPIWKFR